MCDRTRRIVSAVAAIVVLSAVAGFGQQRPSTTAQGAPSAVEGRGREAPPPGPPHNPRDLSGIWLGRAATFSDGVLSFTSAGKAAFDANKPSFGPRAVPPALGNDPLGGANPPGIPRGLISHATKIQFIPLPDKTVQLIEWNRVWREIFTDGRPLPQDPDPAWYGSSIGRWEGDEFLVETIGLDTRAWGDMQGVPKSEDARVQERYRRLDRDNLQLTITITDPKYFTKPITLTNMWRLQPNTPTGNFIEDIFAPIDEQTFNQRVRDPAGGVVR
jgi:hypothetical protein